MLTSAIIVPHAHLSVKRLFTYRKRRFDINKFISYNRGMRNKIKYDEALNEKIGSVLRRARKEKHISLRTAGAGVGVTGQALHCYESGRSVVPLSVFIAIATSYGVDPTSLLAEVLSE